MLSHLPNRIFWSSPAVAYLSRVLTLRRSTVLALLNVRTAEMLRVFGKVVLAVFLRNTMRLCKGVNT